MLDAVILRDLGLIIFGAAFFGLLARAIRFPTLVGYLIAGLMLGPATGLLSISYSVDLIAEVGIILLLFLVGLELSIAKIREVGRVAFLGGGSQVLLTGILVGALAWTFGVRGSDLLFLSVALTFSSTVVVVKLLDKLRTLDTRPGQIAVGILLVQDLVVVLVLTLVSGLGGDELSPNALLRDLGSALGGTGLLLIVAVAAARWVLPSIFHWIAREQQALLILALSVCFTFVLLSEVLHLSLELGAFVAGVSLAQLPYSHELQRRVHPLMNFFVAVFFVTLGVRMDLSAAWNAWGLVLALSVLSLLIKPVLIAHLVRGLGEPPKTALHAGLNLGQSSEFSFILGAMALSQGLIGSELLSIVGAVGLITMGLSSFAITHGHAWVERLSLLPVFHFLTGAKSADRRPGAEPRRSMSSGEPGVAIETLMEQPKEPHVVVVGMNAMGREIVQGLYRAGIPSVAVDTDPEKLKGLPTRTVHGNAESRAVLEAAAIGEARLLVSALQIEDANRLLAFRARAAGIPSVIHVFDRGLELELESIGVTHLLNSRVTGLGSILQALRDKGVFER